MFPNEIICSGGQYESHIPPPPPPNAAAQPQQRHQPHPEVAPSPATPDTMWKGRRSQRTFKVPQSLQVVSDRLALQATSASGAIRFRLWGEILHIFRPVIFVILARHMKERFAFFFLFFVTPYNQHVYIYIDFVVQLGTLVSKLVHGFNRTPVHSAGGQIRSRLE